MRSELRRLVDATCSAVWEAGFRIAHATGTTVTRWSSPGKQRALVVAPHPDDEIACGGTVLLHRSLGDHVTVLHVTDGRRSRALGLDPAAMARRRRDEARVSVEVLGVHRWEWADLPEAEWEECTFARLLEALLAELVPHVVYAPSRVDFHPEHHRVARATARVLGASHRAGTVRVYPIQVPLTSTLTNVIAPIDEVLPTLLRARDAYGSQEGSLRSAIRMKRYAGRAHGVPGSAEEFWQMTGAAYATLHSEEPPRPLVETFRGVRRLALTDPLAYLQGRSERHRLRRLAAG